MVRISVLGDALKTMYNAEKRGKRQVLIRPSSRVVIKFLQVMMKKGEPSQLSAGHVMRRLPAMSAASQDGCHQQHESRSCSAMSILPAFECF